MRGMRLTILKALKAEPMTNAMLQDVMDDCGPYVARTMAGLRKLGVVRNSNPGKGKHAIYHITPLGRSQLQSYGEG